MFRLLHSTHRVNPISLDFDSSVRLVKLHPATGVGGGDTMLDDCSAERLRRASSEVASFCGGRDDAEMTDIQQASSPAAPRLRRSVDFDEQDDVDERLVSTPLMSRGVASFRSTAVGSTPTVASSTSDSQNLQQLQSYLDELRLRRPRRFYEICRVHLAFVTDVPADFLQDLVDAASAAPPTAAPAAAAVRTPSARALVQRVCRTMRSQCHYGVGCESQAASSYAASAPSITAAAVAAAVSASANEGPADDESLNAEILASIERLIRLLDGRLDNEGIFRKSGQVGRQRQLLQLLAAASPEEARATRGLEAAVDDLRCCVHDIAGVLKASLRDLRQPLLTERLQPYFLQLTDLHPHRVDENGNAANADPRLLAARQLRGFRILLQLLPRGNCGLLHSLLRLLRRVADLPKTLMTPENLGTVFGPLLLCPKQVQATDNVTRVIALSNETVAYMIRNVDEIFKVPEEVARDAKRHLDRSRCRSRIQGGASLTVDAGANAADEAPAAEADSDSEDEAVNVSFHFVDRAAASRVNSSEYTQLQVAELYAAVQAMPESSRKAALVRKFNAANNCGLSGPSPSFKRRADR